ncbi:hypothetical protein AC578_7818 [Pseudocercospora eumusae]|uniref:BTB domain-containing protein n=1 Tax=Pseudocercospora eumusae TaxID=321146 RepID=A0A139HJ53_9PEZI|nr:hypothetical protein AC578_7818 [Pseudocercospora eumusae]
MLIAMTNTDVIDIAPSGDVVLICAPSEKSDMPHRLRVSSAILSLASPVFKALLGPKFREGNTLASNGYVEVPLPDDAVEPMIVLLKVLHWSPDSMSLVPKIDEMFIIGAVTDKYDCISAISHSAHFWISSATLASVDAETAQLITLARIFRQDALFTQLCDKLIMQAVGNIAPPVAAKVVGLEALFLYVERERNRLRAGIMKVIEDRIGHEAGPYSCNASKECPYGGSRLNELVSRLNKKELWPAENLQKVSVEVSIQKLRAFSFEWLQNIKLCSDECHGPCWRSHAHQHASRVQNGVEMVMTTRNRFCLQCVRDGDMESRQKCKHT